MMVALVEGWSDSVISLHCQNDPLSSKSPSKDIVSDAAKSAFHPEPLSHSDSMSWNTKFFFEGR